MLSRQLLDEIDSPLLSLFASLFLVTDAFARTGLADDALRARASHGLLPDRVSLLAPVSLFLSDAIGNVPAVVMILQVWRDIPEGTLIGFAMLSTLAGNLLLVGSSRQSDRGRARTTRGRAAVVSRSCQGRRPDHATLTLLAGLWLSAMGLMRF